MNASSASEILVAHSLSKRYGALTVLEDISLSLYGGQSLAIIGPSGSGKTTLLSLLAGLDKPDSGQLKFGARDLVAENEEGLSLWRRDHLGMVFQDYHLIPSLSALENAALPLEIRGMPRADSLREAEALLNQVGVGARGNHLPHQMSGGEQQRVAIARALAAKPALLFADEPTGNLDERTATSVEDLLFGLVASHGIALVVVTHNPTLAKRCDRILSLHLGRLA